MIFELTKYERNVSDIVTWPRDRVDGFPKLFGHYSLMTPRSVLYIRGNIFAAISFAENSRREKPQLESLVKLLSNLDQYLKCATVDYSQARVPNMSITMADGPTDSDYDLTMLEPDTMAPRLFTTSSNPKMVFFTGPTSNGGPLTARLHFNGRTVPDVQESATLTITAAHCDTFHPASTTVNVTL